MPALRSLRLAASALCLSAGLSFGVSLGLLSTEARADEAADLLAILSATNGQRMVRSAPKITASQVQQALSGQKVKGIELVEGVPSAKGYGLTVVDLPVEKLWSAIIDADLHENAMPLKDSRKLQGKRCAHNHLIFQYIDLPVISDRWWITRIRYNGPLYTSSGGKVWELGFEDVHKDQAMLDGLDPALKGDGIPIAWTKGSWTMISLSPTRTFVQYYVWSDPGGSIPAGPASKFSAGAVEDTLKGVEALARAGKSTCGGAAVRPDGSPL